MTTQDHATRGQVNSSAAEIYEAFFVPALFGQWPETVLDRAGLSTGDAVLDVGCGTGILARAAERRLEGSGSVIGIDMNDGMLAVAGRTSERVSWQRGAAEQLAFPDGHFDRVVSQFALMFFDDQKAAVAEMARVAKPGGTITVATWARVEESPGYHAMVEVLERTCGSEAAAALLAPFTVGTVDALQRIMTDAMSNTVVTRHDGIARFESIEDWVHTDVRGWTLADMISDEQFTELLDSATTELAQFVDSRGRVCFPAPALIASATKR